MRDNPDIVEVVRNTYGITSADSESPLIKTLHLNPCVGIVYYDRDQKIAGIAHLRENRSDNGVRTDLEIFLKALNKAGSVQKEKVELHIVGGWKEESLANSAIRHLKHMGFDEKQFLTNQRSEHEIPNLYTMQGRNIDSFSTPQNVAIDARNGKLFDIEKRLPSKYANTGSLLNMLKIGSINHTPDPRSL